MNYKNTILAILLITSFCSCEHKNSNIQAPKSENQQDLDANDVDWKAEYIKQKSMFNHYHNTLKETLKRNENPRLKRPRIEFGTRYLDSLFAGEAQLQIPADSSLYGHNCQPVYDRSCRVQAWSCCDDLDFDNLATCDFKDFTREYREESWRYTSPHYRTNPFSSREVQSEMTSVAAGLDARFMDIDIDELDNYICHVKNSEENAPNFPNSSLYNPDKPESCLNVLRFYYIRYPEVSVDDPSTPIDEVSMSNKHSLAIVPVKVDYSGPDKKQIIKQTEYLDLTKKTGASFGSIFHSVQDYNRLCPPLADCYKGSRVMSIGGTIEHLPNIVLEQVDCEDANSRCSDPLSCR